MSKKNLSFKNLKIKKIISVIMSMTMSLNCVVAHAEPGKHKRGKNHTKNQRQQTKVPTAHQATKTPQNHQQTTNVPPANHPSPPPAPTQTEELKKEIQIEKKSNFQTASKTQQNQQTNKPDNEDLEQEIKEITFHIGEDTEILPNFEILNENSEGHNTICYNTKARINKDTNHHAIPVTIKIIDGKLNGLFFDETDQDYLNPTTKSKDFDFIVKACETIKTMQQLNEICEENNITPDEIKKNFVITVTDKNGGISLIPFPSIDKNMDLNGILLESSIDQKLRFITYVEMQDNNLLPFLLMKDKKENSLKLSPLLTKKILFEPQIDNLWKNSSPEDIAFFITNKQLLQSNRPIPVDIRIIENFKLLNKIDIVNFIKKYTIGYLSSCENRRNQYSHLFHPGIKEYKSLEEHLKKILIFLNNKKNELNKKFSLFKEIESNLEKFKYKDCTDKKFREIFNCLFSDDKQLNSTPTLLKSCYNDWKKYYDNIFDKHPKTLRGIISSISSIKILEKNKPKLIATLKEIPFDIFSNYLYKQNLLKIAQEKNKISQLTEEEENLLSKNQNTSEKTDTLLNSEKQPSNATTEIKSEQEQITIKPTENDKQNQKTNPSFNLPVEKTDTLLNSEKQPSSATTEIKIEQKPTITNPFKNKQKSHPYFHINAATPLNSEKQPSSATAEIKSVQEQITIKPTENDKQNQKTNPSFNLPVIDLTKFLPTVDDFKKEECKEFEENKANLIKKINDTFFVAISTHDFYRQCFDSKKSIRVSFFDSSHNYSNEKFLNDSFKNKNVKNLITEDMWHYLLGTGKKNSTQIADVLSRHVLCSDPEKNHSSHKEELAKIFPNNFEKIIKYIKGANLSNSFIYSIESQEDTKNNKLNYVVALLTPILKE
ncbi:MAG: hypothetical protein LBT82_02950, partial [Oscillospiraceae bacterium]|nr:hypothetical protein [Oscillospiraceae bacterium]